MSKDLLNFKEFSYSDINFKLLIKDFITFKIKIKDLKKLYTLFKFYKKVIKEKKIKIKYLKMLKPDVVKTGIEMYNKYCYTEDITLESLYKYFIEKLKEMEDTITEFTKDPKVILTMKICVNLIDKFFKNKKPQ